MYDNILFGILTRRSLAAKAVVLRTLFLYVGIDHNTFRILTGFISFLRVFIFFSSEILDILEYIF